MKFKFEQFGYIDKGEVELADLTLICGPNNVGKTYISYAIYGFLKHFRSLVSLNFDDKLINDLFETGSIQIDMEKFAIDIKQYFSYASNKFSSKLDGFFNAPDDFFKKSKFDFYFTNFEPNLDLSFKQKIQFGSQEIIRLDKSENNPVLSIVLQLQEKNNKIPKDILRDIIAEQLAHCLFSQTLLQPFVVTSERTGIALFYKELDISKNAILQHLSDNEKINPIELFNSLRSRYAEPIKDNIDVIRDYDNLNKQKSYLNEDRKKYKAVYTALQGLIAGNFKTKNGQVLYRPRKERGKNEVFVPVYLASSSIKSLFLLDFYINSLAKKGSLLIIDEPELNLHPDNQSKIAGLLARLVNSGIKVLVTTHSDHFIKEINNCIMLSNNIKNKELIMNNNKFIEEDILQIKQVAAYTLGNDHSINAVKVDKYGIALSIFDDLINHENEISDNIYYNIEE